MAVTLQQGWDPSRYAAFRGLRLRPALDLLAQVPDLPAGDVVDLGCGDGAAAGPLRLRFPERRLLGLDGSAEMLARAAGYDAKVQADIAGWQADSPPALIFSNAVLQWLPDHAALMPRLAGLLSPDGVLAVQMPRNHLAPSHALLRDTAARLFPDLFSTAGYVPPVQDPAFYRGLLAPLGRVTLWETEYLQELAPAAAGHPVRAFTESTAMLPFLDRLTRDEGAVLTAAYDAALAAAYPLLPEGGALFPFRRLFFICQRF